MFFKKLIIFIISTSTVMGAVDPKIIAEVEKVVSPQIGTRIDSSVIGIFDHGSFAYLSFGKATPTAIFEIGSITKTFTSLMFSIAIDKGLVTQATTLGEIRPEWKNERLGSVTLLELATHRSGLSRLPCNLVYTDENNPYKDYSEKDLIESITNRSIDSIKGCEISPHPTKELNYSNWGSALLGYAISVRAGISYQEVLKNWITLPLGMVDTVVELDADQKTRLIQGYTQDNSPTPPWDRISMLGNGALKSTAVDMMIYARAMLRPQETPFENAIRRVQALQYSNIGYNWFITPAGNIWHNGMTGGYSSLIKAYIKKDFAIFNLTNSENELNCMLEVIEDVPCDPLLIKSR